MNFLITNRAGFRDVFKLIPMGKTAHGKRSMKVKLLCNRFQLDYDKFIGSEEAILVRGTSGRKTLR